jgi:hypothetical protein
MNFAGRKVPNRFKGKEGGCKSKGNICYTFEHTDRCYTFEHTIQINTERYKIIGTNTLQMPSFGYDN